MHQVAALIYEGLHIFEYSCIFEVFGRDEEKYGEKRYELTPFSFDPHRTLRTQGGFLAPARSGLDAVETADTILIPGWPIERNPEPQLVDALVSAHERGARIASVCSGAFALAATGLLDDRRATTHWVCAEAFANRFPRVQLDCSALYIDSDRLITSAGSAAGIDMMLDLIRQDYGSKVCNERARRLIIPPHRDGGQAQFINQPVPSIRGSPLTRVIELLRNAPDNAMTISALAREAGMSERTLYRKFRDSVGMTPHEFVIHHRIGEARRLLEAARVGERGVGAGEIRRLPFRPVTVPTRSPSHGP